MSYNQYPNQYQPHAPIPPKKKSKAKWVVLGIAVLGFIAFVAMFASCVSAVDNAVDESFNSGPVAASENTVEPDNGFTVSQNNAIDKAESYLSHTAFSKSGLVSQIEFEGFPTADAEFAVDHVDVNWTEQAKAKAASYMKHSSFSEQGLVDQLVFEGFTQKQAERGAASQF